VELETQFHVLTHLVLPAGVGAHPLVAEPDTEQHDRLAIAGCDQPRVTASGMTTSS